MPNTALLNNVDHHDLRVRLGHSEAFGDNVNLALVFPNEFEEVQREYPILFAKDGDGDLQAFALLGLDTAENLFLGERGWEGRYVPAFLQRGPFLIGMRRQTVDGVSAEEPMIHVDLDHPRISREEGEPLFLPHGGNSPYLQHVAGVLQTIHQGAALVRPMVAAFEALELIRPTPMEIKLSETEVYDLPNFHIVSEERLATLTAAELERLHAGGFLRAAFMAASSLANVQRLIALKNRKRGL